MATKIYVLEFEGRELPIRYYFSSRAKALAFAKKHKPKDYGWHLEAKRLDPAKISLLDSAWFEQKGRR